MTATCTNCETTFRHVDRNEDGSPAIESVRCAFPGCPVDLCRAGCKHLSFECEGCGKRLCTEHQIDVDGMTCCLGCAIETVEGQEPDCTCRQTDVDIFDARGCEFHDRASRWNVRRRAVTAVQQDEQWVA